jgi:hypothetical protein
MLADMMGISWPKEKMVPMKYLRDVGQLYGSAESEELVHVVCGKNSVTYVSEVVRTIAYTVLATQVCEPSIWSRDSDGLDIDVYPRARLAPSPEWRLAGDQIYTSAYVYLITYPRWIELQGIGGGTFPTLDKAGIWICYSVYRVALSQGANCTLIRVLEFPRFC